MAGQSDWQLEDFDAATRDEVIWVATQNGHRLGFASVWTNDNFLHNLFVDPQYQSHGVGQMFWNRCRRRLPVRVRLSVW
jgi:ribosomal protein S18 acetylase RimI-like enzyme